MFKNDTLPKLLGVISIAGGVVAICLIIQFNRYVETCDFGRGPRVNTFCRFTNQLFDTQRYRHRPIGH